MIFGPFIGFSMFGGMLVGWAKPTPINTRNFRKIVRDDNLTTMAGPASNLLIVLVAVAVMVVMAIALPNGRQLFSTLHRNPQPGCGLHSAAAGTAVHAGDFDHLSLCIFNLLPIPPLDGSRLMRNMLPYNAVQAYDRIPIWVSYLLMIFVAERLSGLSSSPQSEWWSGRWCMYRPRRAGFQLALQWAATIEEPFFRIFRQGGDILLASSQNWNLDRSTKWQKSQHRLPVRAF